MLEKLKIKIHEFLAPIPQDEVLTTSDTAAIIRQVRKIEFKTKSLSNHLFSGEYHSAFKGRGMSFSEVREYQYGDDVRNIDWNVSARLKKPHIKIFEEERELTLLLMIDVSKSTLWGTHQQSVRNRITEMAALLAFSAISNHDKVGVVLFSDKIEKYIPPQKGKSHILHIIRELITITPTGSNTDINKALEFTNSVNKKSSILFLLSDFLCTNFSPALRIASRRNDLIAVQVTNNQEILPVDVGLLQIRDYETGELKWIDTSDKISLRKRNEILAKTEKRLKAELNKNGADYIKIAQTDDYVQKLHLFFKRRISKR